MTWAVPSEAQPELRARVYASGFASPVAFVQDPTDRTLQYVVQQDGHIRVVRDGSVLATDFLDLSSAILFGGEQGLLGMAFAPDYSTSERFYVNFTNGSGNTVVARFKRSANPVIADSASRFDLHWGGASGPAFIAQPYANHNGGNLVFGPDGFLYIGMGDGGSGNDPQNRAQNPAELLGKMLRIDVNVPDGDPSGYQVPSSNPFIGTGPPGTRPEIWSFGLRNPWRYSFDDPAHGGTGALVIGDVGQDSWEEVDYEPPNHGGRNYGWRVREGAHDNDTSMPPAFLPLVDPIYEYNHTVGHAIMGGYVYRGRGLGLAYRGRYFFADEVDRRLWSMAIDPTTGAASNVVEHTTALGGAAQLGNITSFGLDADGELYVVSYSLGAILKIVPAVAPPIVPARDGDFDGDAKADMTVFRPSASRWLALNSSTNRTTSSTVLWGLDTDVPVPADYDGDGKIDPAMFRPSTGAWYILQSSTNDTTFMSFSWGVSTDVPVPADYDGDGKVDPAAYRPSTGQWFILKSSTSYATGFVVWWGVGADVPLQGDYDGDGKADPAVYRPSAGVWFILKSSANYTTSMSFSWGVSTDIPVPADYDGDFKVDPAVYRPSTGQWWVLNSSTSYTTSTSFWWGVDTDVPVPADYDGDGKTDPAVYRPSTGQWLILKSTTNYTTNIVVWWGVDTDTPINRRP